MIDHILELQDADIKVMPVKSVGTDIYHIHEYRSKFATGLSEEEHRAWIAKGYNGLAVIMGEANPTLLALDFDEKHNGGVPLFDRWRKLISPELYARLVIERTRSGGYHVYFFCPTKPKIHAIAANEQGRELVALRGNFNGITYCAPTNGYTFIQKSLTEVETLEFEEVMQLIEAAYTLNSFTGNTITQSGGLKKYSASRYPSPPVKYEAVLKKFDAEIEEMFIPELLVSIGWSYNQKTIDRPREGRGDHGKFIEMFRPGKAEHEKKIRSAAYYYEKKRLSVYTDDQGVKLPSINNSDGLASWLSPYMVLYYLNDRNWELTYQKVIEVSADYKIDLPERTPMVYATPNRDGSLTYRLEIMGVQEWAINAGYKWFRLADGNDSPVKIVKVVDNVIYDVEEADVHREYMEEVRRSYPDASAQRILVTFMPRIMSYLTVLPVFDGEMLRDKDDRSYMFFNNGIVEITKSQVKLHRYQDLHGHIFASDIKDIDYKKTSSLGDFSDFIDIVSIDEKATDFIKSCLGYILHSYKKKSFAKALMIIEDVEDQEEARGRSGKGLIGQFVKYMRNTVEQDGKVYKSDSQFKMQRVGVKTDIFYINDPTAQILMQQFYNFITDDFTVEMKGKTSFVIPYKLSPKLLITTNYLPPLESDSDKDRFIVMAIKKVFSATYRFQDVFKGPDFFSDEWPEKEKLAVYNFAIECIQMYLRDGIIKYENIDIKQKMERRLISTLVPGYLIEVMENAFECAAGSVSHRIFEEKLEPFGVKIGSGETLVSCFQHTGDSIKIYSQKLWGYCQKAYSAKILDKFFGRKLSFFLQKSGYNYIKERDKNGRFFEVKIAAINEINQWSKREKVNGSAENLMAESGLGEQHISNLPNDYLPF
jgi:hypothetical protein